MGATSKPLHIVLEQSLYDTNKDEWNTFVGQGHTIEVITGPLPDLYLASFAMRMTADMLVQLPAALKLAIQGARALRYAPHGVTIGKGKKGVKAKVTRKRKNSKVEAEAPLPGQLSLDSGSIQPETTDQGVGGSTGNNPSEAPNNERIIKVNSE